MKKFFPITFIVALIISCIYDMIYEKTLSNYVFLVGCLSFSIFTFVKIPKETNIKIKFSMAVVAILIDVYALLDVFLPELFFKYKVSSLFYVAVIVTEIFIYKYTNRSDDEQKAKGKESTGDSSLC